MATDSSFHRLKPLVSVSLTLEQRNLDVLDVPDFSSHLLVDNMSLEKRHLISPSLFCCMFQTWREIFLQEFETNLALHMGQLVKYLKAIHVSFSGHYCFLKNLLVTVCGTQKSKRATALQASQCLPWELVPCTPFLSFSNSRTRSRTQRMFLFHHQPHEELCLSHPSFFTWGYILLSEWEKSPSFK